MDDNTLGLGNIARYMARNRCRRFEIDDSGTTLIIERFEDSQPSDFMGAKKKTTYDLKDTKEEGK